MGAYQAERLREHLRSHGAETSPIPANQLDFVVLTTILADPGARAYVDTRSLVKGQIPDLPEDVLLTSLQVPESFLDAYRLLAAQVPVTSYAAERTRRPNDSPAETFGRIAEALRRHLRECPEARMVVNVAMLRFFEGLL